MIGEYTMKRAILYSLNYLALKDKALKKILYPFQDKKHFAIINELKKSMKREKFIKKFCFGN
jgi:hypothetical protein